MYAKEHRFFLRTIPPPPPAVIDVSTLELSTPHTREAPRLVEAPDDEGQEPQDHELSAHAVREVLGEGPVVEADLMMVPRVMLLLVN